MNKIYLLGICIILLSGIAFAADPDLGSTPEPFDLWYLLVENVFGNLYMAIGGIALCLWFICASSKMSVFSTYVILGLFGFVMMMFTLGAIGAVLATVPALIYFGKGMINVIEAYS